MKKTLIKFILYIVVIFSMFKCLELFNIYSITIGDNSQQHLILFDNIRENFFNTHDLFPQYNLNLGLGSSYAMMFYYGAVNPLLWISLLFPFINTYTWIVLIFSFLIASNIIFIEKFIKSHNYSSKTAIITALVMTSVSGIVYNFNYHYMFAYYIPFMTLNLMAIDQLIKYNKKSLFIIISSLCFYFNFFQAPIVGVVSFTYFVIYGNVIDIKERKFNYKLFLTFILSYFMAVLIGTFVLLINYDISSNREVMSIEWSNFFSFKQINQVFIIDESVGYNSILILPGLIYGLFNKNKIRNLSIILIIFIFYNGFDYIMNDFQYLKFKYVLILVPLFALTFANFIDTKLNFKKSIIIFIVVILTYLSSPTNKLYINISILMYVVIFYNFKKLKVPLVLITAIIYMLCTFNSKTKISNPYDYLAKSENKVQTIEYKNTLQRKKNSIDNFYKFYPGMYTSFEFKNYVNMFLDASFPFQIEDLVDVSRWNEFDTNFAKQFFSIPNDINDKYFINGVSNNQVYNIKNLTNNDSYNNLIELNDKVFIENGNTKFNRNNYDQEYHIKNKNYNIDKKEISSFKLPKQIKEDGSLVVQATVHCSDTGEVHIGKSMNYIVQKMIYRTPRENNSYIWDIDIDKGTSSIDYMITPGEYNFSNIKVGYISNKTMQENQINYYEPTNQEVIENKGYKFDIDMLEDGILNTTIVNAPGFKINVDGQEVDSIIVNKYFLGANLKKGKHTIEITYHIHNYFLYLIISLLSFIITIFSFKVEYLKKNKCI